MKALVIKRTQLYVVNLTKFRMYSGEQLSKAVENNTIGNDLWTFLQLSILREN